MQHFYIDREIVPGEQIELSGEDHNHIKNVLRMKRGEKVVINDTKKISHICALAGFGEGCSYFSVEESSPCETELEAEIILYQGVPKKDKMDLIIEKAVEMELWVPTGGKTPEQTLYSGIFREIKTSEEPRFKKSETRKGSFEYAK